MVFHRAEHRLHGKNPPSPVCGASVEAAEAYFRSKIVRRTIEELAGDYEKLDVLAVLLAWDAETAPTRSTSMRIGSPHWTRVAETA
jgi:hypothetical protein